MGVPGNRHLANEVVLEPWSPVRCRCPAPWLSVGTKDIASLTLSALGGSYRWPESSTVTCQITIAQNKCTAYAVGKGPAMRQESVSTLSVFRKQIVFLCESQTFYAPLCSQCVWGQSARAHGKVYTSRS